MRLNFGVIHLCEFFPQRTRGSIACPFKQPGDVYTGANNAFISGGRMRVPIAIAISFAAMSASCAAAPQVDAEAEASAVRARSEAVVRAESAMDAEAAAAFFAEDAIVQPAGSPQLLGRAAILDDYRQFFSGGTLKEFSGTTSGLRVAASGDLAYEYGVNRLILAGPDGDLLDNGKYLTVWKKIDGEWYVAALSFTSDTPAPVPVTDR
jgi:uncharacterized protein (TIGR02246 family)